MFCLHKRIEKIMFFISLNGVKSVTKEKTVEAIKRELLNSLQENDDVEEQGLNETANNVKNSQQAILMINRCEGIIKTQNKKAVGYNGKQRQLFKKFKDTEHFCNNVGHNRSTTYFKYLFINYLRNTLCFKNPSYSQVILKIVLNLSRLFAKKAQLFCIDH